MEIKGNAEALARRVAEAQAKADAKAAVAELKTTLRDDVLTSETKGAVANMGLGSTPVKATNDADMWVPLYHAYDGRAVPVPMYMVEKRLTDRFSYDPAIPSEFHGGQVWFHYPQPNAVGDKPYQCRISIYGTEEMKEAMKAAGLMPVCRKPATFATQFEADEHFRIKHRRRWEAWQRYLAEAKGQDSGINQLVELLAQRLSPQVS